ncbi:HPF/RaiA family ribosome-associated protein [Agriterribacter sp.]|uniref:HPF/RaiA family ribosome-associated protein n=1 Tax=Agriterribacter sp. TaxID=2821509 RepID=UPI002BE206B4|nr:HPF/RaiA family ribosome-associated protein [Agriterribacter sp.]HTN08685.1 HPF/RaiA family ribosome-associated protein [Agriterribacter sp.]
MKFRIETPGHRASPSLKAFVTQKLSSLDKYYKDIQEVEVTLLNEVKGKNEVVNCTLNIRIPGKDEYIKTKSSIFEDAVLKAAEAAKRRLRIRKTQLQLANRKKTANRKVSAKVARKAAKKSL